MLEPQGSFLSDWKMYLNSSEQLQRGEWDENDWRLAKPACEMVLVTPN